MYEIGTLGRWEHIPEEAAAVYDKDIPKLKKLLQNGWNINDSIALSQYIKAVPLEIAV